MTASDLTDLLITQLSKASGSSRGHWRRVLGPVRLYPIDTHPSCNWAIEPSGSVGDVSRAQNLLDRVRIEHPIIGK